MRQRVKDELKEQNLSVKELAKKLGIRYQTITDWLNGSKKIKYAYFETICAYLDVDLDPDKRVGIQFLKENKLIL